MSTRVIRVTLDGRTTTVRGSDPSRVLNVGPAGTGSGGGAVDSVNAQTGVVVLTATDVGADAAGTATAAVSTHAGLSDPHPGYLTPAEGNAAYDALGAAATAQAAAIAAAATDATTKANAAQAASQPVDSDLTAVAALTTTAFGRALLELANAAAGRTALGLGTAAVAATGDFDAAGAAASAQAASQPLDSDLTALAALSTTSYGRSLLEAANASALRTLVGLVLGTDIYSKSAVDSGFQPLDSDLTSIAALTTTSYGRAFLALADAAAARTAIGVDATGTAVLKSLYDANTMLYATTDDTPVALTVAASRIVGRKATGDIVALTGAEAVTILGITASVAPVINSYGGGNVTVSSTTWVDVVGSAFDLAINAVAGDQVEVGASMRIIGPSTSFHLIDVITMVSGTKTTSIGQNIRTAYTTGNASQGVLSWWTSTGLDHGVGGGFVYTVQAGDLVGGVLTLRMVTRVSGGNSSLMIAGSTNPLQWWAKNLGH